MTGTDKPRRGRLSKLAKRLLWAAVPVSVLVGFAIWVRGKTEFTPDLLEKHGFKFRAYYKVEDFDGYVYRSEVPLGNILADFENEMTNRGFDVESTDFGDFSRIDVSNGGIMLGYLMGNDQIVEFHQYRIHSIAYRLQLATGWRFIP